MTILAPSWDLDLCSRDYDFNNLGRGQLSDSGDIKKTKIQGKDRQLDIQTL